MTVFEKMLSAEKKQAFLDRKNASYGISEEEILELNTYITSEEIDADIRRLMEGDFFFEIPTMIRLRKNNSNKRRKVYRFPAKERMLMQYMAYVMHDYDYLYSKSLYSFRIGRHISDIFYEISRNSYAVNDWVLKGDITGFGDHVDPEILCEQLRDIYEKDDPQLLGFFQKLLLRGEFYERGKLSKAPTGALSGCALTNFFENIYLLDVDEMIISHSDYYCRFADDIAIFMKTKEETEALLQELRTIFAERGLSFNEGKTEIVPPGGSFELLGFNVEGKEYNIAESSLNKIEWKLRHRAKKLVRMQRRGWITKEEAEQKMIDRVNDYFFVTDKTKHELNWAAWAFRVITGVDSLKRLDECAQSCIRYAGSGGKSDKSKYRVRYKDMRRKGYRTLVHAYYHKEELFNQ